MAGGVIPNPQGIGDNTVSNFLPPLDLATRAELSNHELLENVVRLLKLLLLHMEDITSSKYD